MKKSVWIGATLLCLLVVLLFSAKNFSKICKRPIVGIPILMYHSISPHAGRFSVTPAEFRNHLEKLYKAGYTTASLADVLAKKKHLTYKKSVILRFDDSRRSQFNYHVDAQGIATLDPDCAVGIILDFYKKHPSFGKNALFCITPHVAFGQPTYIKQKLLFLLDEGMELANHGYYHVSLVDTEPADIDANFGKAMAYWHKILGPQASLIRYVATPYGTVPAHVDAQKRLRCFEYKNVPYPQSAVLFAGHKHTKACHLPWCKELDPYELPSIEVTTENFDEILTSLA